MVAHQSLAPTRLRLKDHWRFLRCRLLGPIEQLLTILDGIKGSFQACDGLQSLTGEDGAQSSLLITHPQVYCRMIVQTWPPNSCRWIDVAVLCGFRAFYVELAGLEGVEIIQSHRRIRRRANDTRERNL